MPTYEYRCDACDHEFEQFQSITASALRKCPECGKLRLKRLIGTGAGVIFKGSGFYETDYRSEGYKKAAKAESDSAKPEKSDGKSEGKAESKNTETKTDGPTKSAKPTSDTKAKAKRD